MDINWKLETNVVTKNVNFGDTPLWLTCFGNEERSITRAGNGRSHQIITNSDVPDDDSRLVLALGPTPTSYSGLSRSKSIELHQGLSSETGSILKLSQPNAICSGLTMPNCAVHENRAYIPVVDKCSTTAKKTGGYMMDGASLLSASNEYSESVCLHSQSSIEPSAVTASGASSDQRPKSLKKCRFPGCLKGARGASGLCISHGGGQRCLKEGCSKGAESRTAYCKAHGGGRRCEHLGCTKSAEGKTDYCIAHGGGKRCGYPGGCTKAARGRSGLCIRHGGGKRCAMDGCARSAEGQTGLCISHGGGRRCQFQGCTKGAQGMTRFCKAHGGGKRCTFPGCTKGAEGSTPLCKGHGGGKRCLHGGGGVCPKSVHGGTDFCVAHGGGKRCAVAGCTKSARGRTDCCVRHGGGKRCRFDNCGKSAQGSTCFCKAHGGGNRCTWKAAGDGKCEKFARGRCGLCVVHARMVQEQVTDPGLVNNNSSSSNNNSSSGVSMVSDSMDVLEWQLLPLSMTPLRSAAESLGAEKQVGVGFGVPEGRVHGGGLMSLFGGKISSAVDGT